MDLCIAGKNLWRVALGVDGDGEEETHLGTEVATEGILFGQPSWRSREGRRRHRRCRIKVTTTTLPCSSLSESLRPSWAVRERPEPVRSSTAAHPLPPYGLVFQVPARPPPAE